jgi:hypothetical protein
MWQHMQILKARCRQDTGVRERELFSRYVLSLVRRSSGAPDQRRDGADMFAANTPRVAVTRGGSTCGRCLPMALGQVLERVKGIEPSSSAWKAVCKPSKIKGCLDFSGVYNPAFRAESLYRPLANDAL